MANYGFFRFLLSCNITLILFGASSGTVCPERCDCQQTQHLLCANRGLQSVPKGSPAEIAEGVRVFGLAGNFIHNISAFDFARYGNLMRLNLQFNQIQTIHPQAFEKLSKLEELYLGNNLISTIQPGTLQTLKKLTVLYINSNHFKDLTPASFSNLGSVTKLRLDGNSIETLNESVLKSFSTLMFLHLESNQLHHIHRGAFSGLTKLRFLNLSDNKQTELRDIFTFSHLRSLITLLLSGNQIRHVGNHVFQNLKKLSKLSLSNNRISVVDSDALKGLSRVREFMINGNELAEIPAGLLDPLERIEQLDFSDNRISRVASTAFEKLAHLKVLNLKNNRLTSLSGGVFGANGVLFNLDLSGNNWTCDCRMEKLKAWMTEVHSQGKLLTVFVRCHHPASLEGKYLDYVNNSQLVSQGNHSLSCVSAHRGQPMESRGGTVLENPVPRRESDMKRGERERTVWVQGDEGKREDGGKLPAEKKKQRKAVSGRSHPTLRGHQGHRKGPLTNTTELSVETTASATEPNSSSHDDEGGVPSSQAPEPAFQERFDLLLQERVRYHEGMTDACRFNRQSILNVSVDHATAHTATVHWSTAPDSGADVKGELMFRVLFDRFGHTPRFPRYVYTEGSARSVALHELRADSTYMACVESAVGGVLCQVAPRDHCVGFVTLSGSEHAGSNLQLVTVSALVINALLLLLIGGAWLGRVLKRRIKSRKSAVHGHVRHIYSTRRPLRTTMATTCATAEFSGYQSSRPLAEVGDLIQFPSDRFFDGGSTRREGDVMMPRFSN
ncbi:TLR4 interactor with leucine rich repeats [Chanos chanos]|uniref:TLR4 interactor with leucine rich repeats n=1 Tax=Chanos chanos TaxID=29144 RepID=A0A6J2WJJ8_CHACN|nr:TLR4 interactor with leucine rich repeats [Chanos chanos]